MNTEIINYIVTAGATLIVKFLWDKYISKDKKVDVALCIEYRRLLSAEMNILKSNAATNLYRGDDLFKKITTSLSVSMYLMLELCKEVGIDCTELRKKLYEGGILNGGK